jgi:hypothetical protein
MISLQFGYAGMNIITKVSLNHGMSHVVLVVYRHAFAALSIAPFAIIIERRVFIVLNCITYVATSKWSNNKYIIVMIDVIKFTGKFGQR